MIYKDSVVWVELLQVILQMEIDNRQKKVL